MKSYRITIFIYLLLFPLIMTGEDIKDLIAKGDTLKAWAVFDEKKYEQAIAYYDKVLQILPNHIPALKNKADCLGALHKFDEAEEILNKILELDSNYYEVYSIKAAIIAQKTGNTEREKEVILQGLRILDQLLTTKPDSAELWDGKARMLWSIRHNDEALAAIDQAIKLNPKDAGYWLQKGVILKDPEVKRYEDALKAYDEALKIAPEDGLIWTHKSGLLLLLKRYEEALQSAEKEISLNPNLPRGWRHKANALQMLGRYSEAIKCYEKSLVVVRPKEDYAVYQEIAFCYLEMSNYDSAIKYAQRYLGTLMKKKVEDPMYKAFPEPEGFNRLCAKVYYLIACAYSGKKDDNNAIENLKKAIELNPQLKKSAKESKYLHRLSEKDEFRKIVRE